MINISSDSKCSSPDHFGSSAAEHLVGDTHGGPFLDNPIPLSSPECQSYQELAHCPHSQPPCRFALPTPSHHHHHSHQHTPATKHHHFWKARVWNNHFSSHSLHWHKSPHRLLCHHLPQCASHAGWDNYFGFDDMDRAQGEIA